MKVCLLLILIYQKFNWQKVDSYVRFYVTDQLTMIGKLLENIIRKKIKLFFTFHQKKILTN